jgi:hypothetical protein
MHQERAQPVRMTLHSGARAGFVPPPDPDNPNYTLRNSTAHFIVRYDKTLPKNTGPNLADAVLATCEADYDRLQRLFGNLHIANLPFDVHIRPGKEGAIHVDTALYCGAFTEPDADLIRFEVVMEADEVFMSNQGKGWNPGYSNGEALSRVLATEMYPNQLIAPRQGVTFSDAHAWLDPPSIRENWVDNVEPTDLNHVSIGCGTLFINWLRHHVGVSLETIVRAGGANLGETYRVISGRNDGFQRFANLLAWYYTRGLASGLTIDNPFPIWYIIPGLTNVPVTGDWKGLGRTSIGEVNLPLMEWRLRDSLSGGDPDITPFGYGAPNSIPIVGRWTRSIQSGIGAVYFDGMMFNLRDSPSPGNSDTQFQFGSGNSGRLMPVVGDWDGDGTDGIGVVFLDSMTWFLRNSPSAGPADFTFQYGGAGPGGTGVPVVGDWDGDGKDGIGVVERDTMTWRLRKSPSGGKADIEFQFGGSFCWPVVGHWDGNRRSGIGCVFLDSMEWRLRHTPSAGDAQIVFRFGAGN